MFKARLTALEHPTPGSVDCNDRKTFASTILWLEDQKIRHLRIEDREPLRKTENIQQWEKSYTKYKQELNMPKFQRPTEEMTWLLSYAIRLEYLDAPDRYKSINSKQVIEKTKDNAINIPSVKAENFFDNMDFMHQDFINGVRTLASQLGIANHPDHLVQLEAAAIIIKERIGSSAANRPVVEGTPFPFEKGNDIVSGDSSLDLAVRILRLIQIHKLRDLQTKINETIVTIQDLTADPRTDTKLGKVGF